jgi:soluble lytic murein transglycosylase-like protein/TolA-binding protein
MSYRLFMAVTTVALIVSGSTVLHGTTLPESYPLGEASDREGPLVDPNLDHWLAEHAIQGAPLELDDPEFDKWLNKQDQVTAFLMRLERANKLDNTEIMRSVADEVLKTLLPAKPDTPGKKKDLTFGSHVLAPFLYTSLLRTKMLTPEEYSLVLGGFAQTGVRTCSQKQMILDEISSETLTKMSQEGVRDLLARIDQFYAPTFKKTAYRRVLANLPEAKQAAMAPIVLPMLQPFPSIIKSVSWLKSYADKVQKPSTESQLAENFEEVQQLAARGQCRKGADSFPSYLAKIKDKKDQGALDTVLNAVKAVDTCLKQEGSRARIEVLEKLGHQLSDAFGFRGWAEAQLRIAYVYWTADQFDQAKTLFEEVRKKAESGEGGESPKANKALAARALYSLGKIAENEKDADKAAGYFRDYMRLYVDQANIEEVLMALVLIHADKGEWAQAMAPVEAIIANQSQLSVDERSVSAMSFALFWGGRIHLEQGRPKDASEMWRRVASEYYSTYYGAMGHYLLEELTGRRLMLQPWRNPPFQIARHLETLSPQGRLQMNRVQALLKIGFKAEAACELEEIDLADGRPEKLLLKSLVLYASSQFLEAVKAYDNLPRSFRNSLPSGFERILFPLRYHEQVRSLASKAEVDPDLVMAIIRQESVFNPMAKSPVGALGLMQLMPATALSESKRLSAGYLSPKARQEARSKAANPTNLLEAETNLQLGVHHVRSLLTKYNSPVYVLSAYNASPSAAQRWMNSIPTKDVLSFIERIPYKETRAYVKLVLRNYFYYKRWYGEPADAYKHLDIVAQKLVAMLRDPGKSSASSNH